jgi:hypothetical protein
MTKMKNETALTVDGVDMARILTEALCPYGAFVDLEVTGVSQNSDGDFDLVLSPKPPEAA